MNSPYVRRLRLGKELRALRAEHNMTQARVARLIAKTRNDISKLENGQSADAAKDLTRGCVALDDVDMRELYDLVAIGTRVVIVD